MSIDEDQKLQQKAKRAKTACIISLFLFALTWSIGGFFILFFLGAASFFGFLSVYYRPRQIEREPVRPSWQKQSHPGSAQKINKTILSLIPIIIGVTFFAIAFRVLNSDSAIETESNPIEVGNAEADNSQSVLQSDPNNIDALIDIGNEFYGQGQYDSAMKYYERVLKIDPSNQYAQYNKALVFSSRKDYTRSIKMVRQCLSQHPDYGYAYYLLGDNYRSISRLDSAIICFEQAYQFEVRDADMLQAWGEINKQQGNSAKAIELFKQVVEQDSSRAEIYSRLAELLPSEAPRYRRLAERWAANQ
jgi:tetratricopeptide (TPR) repeat protein